MREGLGIPGRSFGHSPPLRRVPYLTREDKW